MEIWDITFKLSGHIKKIQKIGASLNDLSNQLIKKIPLSDGVEIRINHDKYLLECDEILKSIKYDDRGFEIN